MYILCILIVVYEVRKREMWRQKESLYGKRPLKKKTKKMKKVEG